MSQHQDMSAGEPASPGRQGISSIATRQPSRLQHEGLRSPVTPFVTGRLGATSTNNSTINETDNIKVAVRVRPLLPDKMEKDKGAVSVLQVADDHTTVKVVVPGPAGNKMQRDFQFHACLGPDVTQAEVLHLCGIPQLLDAALAGYNVTIFAYGQTGSGKTYTMSGREEVIGQDSYHGDTNDGIISRSVSYLYRQLKERTDAKFKLSASYLEIYNEAVHDLLTRNFHHASNSLASGASTANLGATSSGSHSAVPQTANGRPVGLARDLAIKWDPVQGFFVPGLKQVTCNTLEQMMEVIRTGMKHRHMGSHDLNMESSRSHSLMTIHCAAISTDTAAWDYGTPRYGKICFVDLAGSERLKDSKSEGTMLKETTNINKSLFVLGKVISALAERDSAGVTTSHIPYRDSKLTKLLMDSLGGSALALMIACCSPSPSHVEETLSTLSYATRAKNIQNRPIVQYDPKEAQITALRREIDLLRQENTYLRDQLSMAGGAATAGLPLTSSLGGVSFMQSPCGPMSAMPADDSVAMGGISRATTARVDWPALRPETNASSPTAGHSSASQGQGFAAGLGNTTRYEQHSSGSSEEPEPASGLSPMPPARGTSMAGTRPRVHGAASAQEDAESSPESRQLVLSTARPSSGSAWKQGGPHSRGFGGGGPADDLTLRLKDTQVLLAKFSEENSRLAKENDRLRCGRVMMNNEHASVLDEIEALRSQLSGLETAVLAGNATPAAVKALLGGLKAQANDSKNSTAQLIQGPRMSSSTPPPLQMGPLGAFAAKHSNSGSLMSSPTLSQPPALTPLEDTSHQNRSSLVTDNNSPSVSESYEGVFGGRKQLGAQATGLTAPTASMAWSPSASRASTSASIGVSPAHQTLQGTAGGGHGGEGLDGMGQPPYSPLLTPQLPSSMQAHARPQPQQHGMADVLAVGTGGPAALHARNARMGSASSHAGDTAGPVSSIPGLKPTGGIIVADPSKLALLLGGEVAGNSGPVAGLGAGSPVTTPGGRGSPALSFQGGLTAGMQLPLHGSMQPPSQSGMQMHQQGGISGHTGMAPALQGQWSPAPGQQSIGSPQPWHPNTGQFPLASSNSHHMVRQSPVQLAHQGSDMAQHTGQYMGTPPPGYLGPHGGVPSGWEGALLAGQQAGPAPAAAFRSSPFHGSNNGKGRL